jgi:uncharacterized membrane protein
MDIYLCIKKKILKEGDNEYLNTNDHCFKMQTMKSQHSMEIKKSKLEFHYRQFLFQNQTNQVVLCVLKLEIHLVVSLFVNYFTSYQIVSKFDQKNDFLKVEMQYE